MKTKKINLLEKKLEDVRELGMTLIEELTKEYQNAAIENCPLQRDDNVYLDGKLYGKIDKISHNNEDMFFHMHGYRKGNNELKWVVSGYRYRKDGNTLHQTARFALSSSQYSEDTFRSEFNNSSIEEALRIKADLAL